MRAARGLFLGLAVGLAGCAQIIGLDGWAPPQRDGGTEDARGTGAEDGQGGGSSSSSSSSPSPDAGSCKVDLDCPSEPCAAGACEAGTCKWTPLPAGSAALVDTPGDCKRDACDGQGKVVQSPDPSDVLQSGRDCLLDVCTGDVPATSPAAKGTPCSDSGGNQCDGAGHCVTG